MNDELRNKIVVASLAAVFAGFFLLAVFKPADSVSLSERRPLAQFPELSAESVLSGSFMEDFDSYAVDQFPMRDSFRSLFAAVSFDVLRKADVEGLYVKDGHVISMEYPMSDGSIIHASQVFGYVGDAYLGRGGSPEREGPASFSPEPGSAAAQGRVYLAVIPDKNCFMQYDSSVLSMDYDRFFGDLQSANPWMKWIEIAPLLELDDYYATDPHWRQERIFNVAQKLASDMGVTLPEEMTIEEASDDFRGTYAGQLGIPLPAEPLRYAVSPHLEGCRVYDHQNGREIPLYDLARAQGRDPYEMFLSGPLSLITIENPSAATDRELVVFRDSFGSAIAPYLAMGYSKVTLVDIRYLPSRNLGGLVDFQDADVLFLYSAAVLNNSETLK